ncbi:MAG: glutamine--fructose-6-phosphate aminotransferase [Candidatus Rokubacteria bacterium GWC2_70_16]|nr:MAG: glutamine--fructose-6-phosphate aminotransferase [Candidatus Rokubacteria bacterium GWC2_70_16]OGL16498.1 MAG: glutamine--fructose-6-phosphate aminotransferase [Candidatus Rokubacteria bacterium RIFCSPLOWO2_12_FULL_71_19]
MCGIVGYIGEKSAVEILLDGLRRLEYRGYDSAGVAVLGPDGLQVRRAAGRIKVLEGLLREQPVRGSIGVGHTRWATHGRPTDDNAHPHTDGSGSLVVVHNGIIENYLPVKERLQREGHEFRSETDTEVIAHLIERHLRDASRLEEAVRRALGELRGSYAIAVLSRHAPDRLVAAKHGAGSVVVGLGEGEAFLASDIPAILMHTRDMVILEDGDLAVVTRHGVDVSQLDGAPVERAPTRILWDPILAEKGGYRHFMLKEIYEQPRAAADTLRGRVSPESGSVVLPDITLDPEVLQDIRRVVLLACGTSYHAAIVARFLVERLAGIAAEVDVASEWRYRDAVVGPDTLVVALSQSGETADTLGAVKAARAKGAPIVGITNVVGSALAREATGILYTPAGPEIGVASSKTFTATMMAGYLLALWLGRRRGALPPEEGRKHVQALLELPRLMEKTLELEPQLAGLARELSHYKNFLFLGRGINFPIALEGALKLKELSYLHAEGYPAGEMKHGPIALIDDGMPVVALVPRDGTYERMMGNVEEVRAREGRVLALAHEGDKEIKAKADWVIPVPVAGDLLTPILMAIPLQLLAYHVAVRLGRDVDQPRNLAKSVTVE